jgi:hypothetical protein
MSGCKDLNPLKFEQVEIKLMNNTITEAVNQFENKEDIA